ncbi:class I SAM-dependent methyltransferase [Vibrio fluvialis]|nr:class I SAM-dependent methyltransferase [Vibrio fluvialis]
MNQEEKWKEHTSEISVDNIYESLNNPAIFQKELSFLINEIALKNNYSNIIEVGCEQGIVSMLTSPSMDRHLLDINEDITTKLSLLEKQHKLGLSIYCEDMFSMSFSDETFDIVHNSGVVEHFDYEHRVSLLTEYARILKNHGVIILSVPNHYSISYRLAYLFHNYILFGIRWPWPKEYKIYDMKSEIEDAGLKLVERRVLAKETTYKFWRPFNFIGNLFKFIDKFYQIEGYLTTLVIKK